MKNSILKDQKKRLFLISIKNKRQKRIYSYVIYFEIFNINLDIFCTVKLGLNEFFFSYSILAIKIDKKQKKISNDKRN